MAAVMTVFRKLTSLSCALLQSLFLSAFARFLLSTSMKRDAERFSAVTPESESEEFATKLASRAMRSVSAERSRSSRDQQTSTADVKPVSQVSPRVVPSGEQASGRAS